MSEDYAGLNNDRYCNYDLGYRFTHYLVDVLYQRDEVQFNV